MSLYVDIEKTLGSFHLKVKLEAADETSQNKCWTS